MEHVNALHSSKEGGKNDSIACSSLSLCACVLLSQEGMQLISDHFCLVSSSIATLLSTYPAYVIRWKNVFFIFSIIIRLTCHMLHAALGYLNHSWKTFGMEQVKFLFMAGSRRYEGESLTSCFCSYVWLSSVFFQLICIHNRTGLRETSLSY